MRTTDIELAPSTRDIAPSARETATRDANDRTPRVRFSPSNGPEIATPRGIVEDEIEHARAAALVH